eukprot:TRINITY_DN27717_c0_g1_i1.p1 TRINITY_DN27717_c0_g1~~TRINITY_DN27717_c0_g1_i1.p1  ORF type:complete len:255 (+),score=69.07 TRINITY_DN27717_c0_g1_i1:158-922(+)
MELEAALRILSQRQTNPDACPCHQHAPAPPEQMQPATMDQIPQELQDLTPMELIRKLKYAQGERVAVYREFELVFRELMESEQGFDQYQQRCAQVTQQFGQISQRIRAIEARMKAEPDERSLLRRIAPHVRDLQQHEQQKLQLTAALQMARQRAESYKRVEDLSNDEQLEKFRELVEREMTDLEKQRALELQGIQEVLETIQAFITCLLYTSDAADEEDSVDLGGRRIIKKKKTKNKRQRDRRNTYKQKTDKTS